MCSSSAYYSGTGGGWGCRVGGNLVNGGLQHSILWPSVDSVNSQSIRSLASYLRAGPVTGAGRLAEVPPTAQPHLHCSPCECVVATLQYDYVYNNGT